MCAGVIRLGLPSTTSKPTFISGIDLQRLDQRVADEVGEGHLAAAGAGEVVVDDGAVVPQQLDRDRADRGGGRDGSARRPCSARYGPARRGARCTSARRSPRPARPACCPWRPAWWCPWPARRPARRGGAWRPGPESSPRPSAAWTPSGLGLGAAFSAAAARLRLGLRGLGRGVGCRLLLGLRGGRSGVAVGAARWPGSTSPTWGRRCRDPSGTGRTSPPRATRWRRSRRRAVRETGCLRTAARVGSPLPVYARGDGFQSSRLDPHASKCSGKGGLSGGVLRDPHRMRD